MTYPVREHINAVKTFMEKANQNVPNELVTPTDEERILRAKLILEEAFETIEKGLGISISYHYSNWPEETFMVTPLDRDASLEFTADRPYDPVEVLDGLCDLSVVGLAGTAITCGFSTDTVEEALEEVDVNNLSKFGEGHSIREDGKLIKPPGHTPPNLEAILTKQETGVV